jgi:hypothetical protein
LIPRKFGKRWKGGKRGLVYQIGRKFSKMFVGVVLGWESGTNDVRGVLWEHSVDTVVAV